MRDIFKSAWALLFGMMLLQLGNGVQGTLLGVRGVEEGFSASALSYVMSAYFIGFLFGAQLGPMLIRRVGHVRVFAALASTVSAAFILYAIIPNIWMWFLLRIIIGFGFSGIYVVAESWLNDSVSNENRGKALAIYVIVQMVGIIVANWMVAYADPTSVTLFAIVSVFVSFSIVPILLSISPVPQFQTTQPMTISNLWDVSPLGMVGMFMLGGIFSALFTMAAVYGVQTGLSLAEISAFSASFYIGGLVFQYPIGWISDNMDRRSLILIVTAIASFAAFLGGAFALNFISLLIIGLIIGGVSNPLYSLLIAYTNDFLDHEQMAAASGGLIFVNGLGAILGPIIVGRAMASFGANMYFFFISILLGLVTLFSIYRSTQRSAPSVEETTSYAPIAQTASPVAVELAQEVAIEMALEAEESEMSA